MTQELFYTPIIEEDCGNVEWSFHETAHPQWGEAEATTVQLEIDGEMGGVLPYEIGNVVSFEYTDSWQLWLKATYPPEVPFIVPHQWGHSRGSDPVCEVPEPPETPVVPENPTPEDEEDTLVPKSTVDEVVASEPTPPLEVDTAVAGADSTGLLLGLALVVSAVGLILKKSVFNRKTV